MIQNPYTSGPIIREPEKFVGRKDIVDKIIREIRTEPIIIVYGQRRVGKSSVLYRVENQLWKHEKGYIPVYFSLEGQLEQSTELLLAYLAETIAGICGLTQVNMPEKISVDGFSTTWIQSAIHETTNKGNDGIVLLLDEFDAINDFVDTKNADAFYVCLRRVLETHHQIRVVAVTGRDPTTMIDSAKSMLKKSALIHIPLMSYREIEELIKLSKEKLLWTVETIEYIWQLTRGHPLLTQSICSRIWKNYTISGLLKNTAVVRLSDIQNTLKESTQEFGHIVDYAWSQLNPQEQFTICYFATRAESVALTDLLDHLDARMLSDLFQNPGLKNILVGLENGDWIERVASRYRIKIPIYSTRIKQTHDLASLTDTLFDNQKRAFDLLAQATNAKDDLSAIGLLERSLKIDPDNLKIQSSLAEKYHAVIRFCISSGNNNLALSYIDRLAEINEDAEKVEQLKRQIADNIKANSTVQRIDTTLYEQNFVLGYALVADLRHFRSEEFRRNLFKVISAHLLYLGSTWTTEATLATPALVTLLALGKFVNVAQISGLQNRYNWIVLLTVSLTCLTTSTARSILRQSTKEKWSKRSPGSALVNIFAVLFLFYGIADIDLAYKLVAALLILVSVTLSSSPTFETQSKSFYAITIDVVLVVVCGLANYSTLFE